MINYVIIPYSPVIGSWNSCILGGEYVKKIKQNIKIKRKNSANLLLHFESETIFL